MRRHSYSCSGCTSAKGLGIVIGGSSIEVGHYFAGKLWKSIDKAGSSWSLILDDDSMPYVLSFSDKEGKRIGMGCSHGGSQR